MIEDDQQNYKFNRMRENGPFLTGIQNTIGNIHLILQFSYIFGLSHVQNVTEIILLVYAFIGP